MATKLDLSPFFQRHRWLAFILPLAVYMLVGSLEPTRERPGGAAIGLAIPYTAYPLVYTVKIALTVAAIWLVFPAWREFPERKGDKSNFTIIKHGASPRWPRNWTYPLFSVLVGVVGFGLWVGLCKLNVEQKYLVPLLKPVGLDWLIASGVRSAFNPLAELADRPAWAWGFLAIRFLGLVAVVPLVEEFFYRGFLMRFVVRHDWWNVPLGQVNAAAVVLATLVPMAMHPAELLAAAVWFSMFTWLFVKTRSIWDCVAAHAVTNLLLGVYVVSTGEWGLM